MINDKIRSKFFSPDPQFLASSARKSWRMQGTGGGVFQTLLILDIFDKINLSLELDCFGCTRNDRSSNYKRKNL